LLVTAQPPHPLPTETEREPEPPAHVNDAGTLAMEMEHPAACDTVTVWPATMRVRVRAAPAFAGTDTCTVPEPCVVEAVALIPDEPVSADHGHDGLVVTVIVAVDADADTLSAVGETV